MLGFLFKRLAAAVFVKKWQHTAPKFPSSLPVRAPFVTGFKNGDKFPQFFSDDEMASRIGKLRKYMSSAGVDGCIFTSYHNVNYFSSFLYTSFGRPYALVVTEDACTIISALIDGGQPWRRSQGIENIIYTDWTRDNFYRALNKLLSDCRMVGLEADHTTLRSMQKFNEFLPEAKKIDISDQVMQMRIKKSSEEQAVIRQGARIADLGGYAALDKIKEGVPEYIVAEHARKVMVREIASTYPQTELMDTWVWFQSGINTDGAHNPLTTRKLQEGDILSLNCFPMISGYYTALERTLFLGHIPSREHEEYWRANCEVHARGLELIKPGAKCCDIVAELNDLCDQLGILHFRTFGYGHSFGSLCHYYGREEALELREDVETVLEPGMVVSMEPMIMIPDELPGAGGYREHDILIVTEDGADNITAFPYGPDNNVIVR